MPEKNTYRIILALILSALVHISIVFYVVEEKDSYIVDVANSIVVRLEMIAGSTESVDDGNKHKRKTEIEKHVLSGHEKIISSVVDKSIKNIKEKNREEVQSDLADKKGAENYQEITESNSDKSDELLKLVYIEINKNKYYPYQARRQHREGRVKINFKLHPDGRVSEITVLESSHFNALDYAAQKAVKSISPFLIAANYLHTETEFNVNIDYRLN